MKTIRSKGFTLIELLVVIAIIGILSAVVLASLNTARSKGNDAAIQSNLSTIQTQAEVDYASNSYYTTANSYGSNTAATTACNAASTIFADPTVANAAAQADSANGAGTVTCNVAAGGSAYAVSAQMVATAGTYWCVDSTGYSGQKTAALGAATKC